MKRRLAMVSTLAALLLLLIAVAPASALDEGDRLYMVGERALADHFYPVARRALERFVAQYPADRRQPRALMMLGKARLALNDSQSALEAFARATSVLTAPADLQDARLWQAEALFRLKRFGEAYTAYDEVVRTDAASPLAPDALYGRALCDLELRRPEAAVTALSDFLTTWPGHAQAPAVTYQLARALVELKRVGEAQALLAAFTARYPGSKLVPDVQYLLGWVKVNNGDPRGGVTDLRAFLAANPRHEQAALARRLVTQVLATTGDREEQAESYKAFMEETPATAEGLSSAVQIATRLSRSKDADTAWRKLKAQFPDHPLTRQMALPLAQAASQQKNYKDAVALGQTAAQSEDEAIRAEAWLIVGESEIKLKRYPQAAKAFESVGAIADVESGVRYRALAGLGLAREEQKEWRAALTAYETVATRSPDSTLRNWARERVTAMKAMLPKPGGTTTPKRSEPAKPSDKSSGRKS